MGSAVGLGNVVRVAEHLLLKAVVPLHGDLDDGAVVAFGVEAEYVVQRRLVTVQIRNERPEAAVIDESFFLAGAFVGQTDADAGIEERQFAQALCKDIVVKFDVVEGLVRRLEITFGARSVRFTHYFQRGVRLPVRIDLFEDTAVPANGQPKFTGQGIDYRDAHAVQTAGHLVTVIVELSAGMQRCHDDLGCGNALVGMDVDRNSPAVISNRHRFAGVDDHLDVIAIARQRFVDRIVDQFLNHVV